MTKKTLLIGLLVLFGIYFLVFHTAPFPFNHNAIGLPPFHLIHSAFGLVLLALAGYLYWKKP